MAVEIGSAANYLDLLGKFRDFVTTNTDLVTAGQEWEVIAGVTTGTPADGQYISFKAPGLGGTDEILSTIDTVSDIASARYNWRIYGHTTYNVSSPGPTQALSSNSIGLLLGNSSIAYWFVASGRCAKIVARFNSRYDVAYIGFGLPDHLPTEWAYPLFIGGSSYAPNTSQASADDFSHSNFWNPCALDSNSNFSQLQIFAPSTQWRTVRNFSSASQRFTEFQGFMTLPWNRIVNTNMARCIDGSAWLQRGDIVSVGPWGSGSNIGGGTNANAPDGGNFYAGFDGVFFTPAIGATSEQIVIIDSKNYLLVPNIARTSDGEFAAILLE